MGGAALGGLTAGVGAQYYGKAVQLPRLPIAASLMGSAQLIHAASLACSLVGN